VNEDTQRLVAQISKDMKLDPDTLVLGADRRDQVLPRASTGVLSLDVALGGGLPLNQWTEILGHESTGKTALALKIVAHHQARDSEFFAVWVAAESLQEEYAAALGVDLSRVLLIDSNSMEEVYDIVLRLARERAFDAVVIDSLPALIPTGEYEGSMEDSQMAMAARLNGKFFRKMSSDGKRSLLNEDRPWLGILINQYRSKVGVMFGDPRTTPGGVAKNYACYVRIETRRDDWLDNGLGRKDPLFRHVGQTVVAKIIKNKSGPPNREASFDFYFAPFEDFNLGDIDLVKDVFLTAVALEVLRREGNSYFLGDDKIGTNRPSTLRALNNSAELREAVALAVTEKLADG
jgi:recombination protein RecA